MDIKWKNSKRLAIAAIIAAILAGSVYIALFPLFTSRAQTQYDDPFISSDFVQKMLLANYTQYKYIREKTDQKQYSYADLFLDIDIQPLYDNESDGGQDGSLMSEEAQSRIDSQKNQMNSVCQSYEDYQKLFGSSMDYYVKDLESGTVISNSGSDLPDAVGGGERFSNYVYYVSMDYDSIGNLTNVSVKAPDNAKQFLSTIQYAGHDTRMIYQGSSLYNTADNPDVDNSGSQKYPFTDDAEMYNITFSVKEPSGIRAIYGITAAQYETLCSPVNRFSLDGMSLFITRSNSYYYSGVRDAYGILVILMILTGLFLCRRMNRNTLPEDMPIIYYAPFELIAFATILLFTVSDRLAQWVYEYENGLFLRNIRTGIGLNGKIGIFSLDSVVMFLFITVLFLSAFLIGSALCDIGSGKGDHGLRNYFKTKSLICRYWKKLSGFIFGTGRSFYNELISYDIGKSADKLILKLVGINAAIVAMICSFWFAGVLGIIIYSVVIYFVLKKYVKEIQVKYRKLLNATNSIARGNLDTALSEDFGVFESYKSELRQIQGDFKRAVNEEVKSQRMKSELITNVSHDLKTPLTAIITYIDLLKSTSLTEEQRVEYLGILERKTNRLKVLIEDLFEVSKASSKAVTLQIVDVDICNLLRQACLEQEDRIQTADLDFRFLIPRSKVVLPLDSQKTYRIIENLYGNIIKYAMKGTRVYIILKEDPDRVRIELKNISATELQISDPKELTERFVRGDDSRNTEGSGLGLAIARSFTELQSGTMDLEIDGDLFKVVLYFQKKNNSGSPVNEAAHSAGMQPDMPPFPGNSGAQNVNLMNGRMKPLYGQAGQSYPPPGPEIMQSAAPYGNQNGPVYQPDPGRSQTIYPGTAGPMYPPYPGMPGIPYQNQEPVQGNQPNEDQPGEKRKLFHRGKRKN